MNNIINKSDNANTNISNSNKNQLFLNRYKDTIQQCIYDSQQNEIKRLTRLELQLLKYNEGLYQKLENKFNSERNKEQLKLQRLVDEYKQLKQQIQQGMKYKLYIYL